MAGWCDEVKQNMHTIVAETWITLDTGLHSQNIVVLSLEIANDLSKTSSLVSHHTIKLL